MFQPGKHSMWDGMKCIIAVIRFDAIMVVSNHYGIPDNKVHGANMGPIWGRQDPGGPHVGPMNFAIWDAIKYLDS